MQPNKVLSKTMWVKPLKPGEVVTYQLAEATEISSTHTGEKGEPKLKSPSWKSARQTMVRDFETGENVIIGCVVARKPFTIKEGPSKSQVGYEEVLGTLKFPGGFLKCTHENFEEYQYAERHSANGSNPFRDPNKPIKYYRLDAKKAAISNSNNLLMKGEALAWIGTADHIEIKAICSSLPDGFKINLDSDFEVIKDELLKLTDKQPILVMKVSNNKATIAKITVMECERFQIIMWDEEKRIWFYNDEKMETLANIEIGQNKYDGMVQVFKKEENGRKIYQRLESRLKKFLNLGKPN